MARKEIVYRLAWHAKRNVWEVRWTDPGPRSRAVSTGATDKAQAEKFLVEWRARERELSREAGEPVLDTLIDAYENDARARGVTPATFWALARVREHMGLLRPSTIEAKTVLEYARRRGVSDGTIRRELNALRAVLGHAVRTKLVPADTVPDVPLPAMPQGRLLFLDDAQESEFYALALGDSIGRATLSRVTRFVALGLDTGARRGAILSLTWDRVDLRQGLIDFREPGRRLSKKRRVAVPINKRLRPLLERAWSEKTSLRSSVCGDGDIRKSWDTWVAKTPFPWATPHVMRHTYATLLIRAGVDLRQVAALLGDDPVTVMRTYAQVAPTWLETSVNARWA